MEPASYKLVLVIPRCNRIMLLDVSFVPYFGLQNFELNLKPIKHPSHWTNGLSLTFIFMVKLSDFHSFFVIDAKQLNFKASFLHVFASWWQIRASNFSQIIYVLDVNFQCQTVEISLFFCNSKRGRSRTINFGTHVNVAKRTM